MSRDRDPLDDETANDHVAPVPTAAILEDRLARGLSAADLRREYDRLREHYEAGRRTPRALSAAAVAAYAVGRVPATTAVSVEALTQLASALGGWEPRSLLDLGAGLGSSAWAAVSTFPTLEQVTLVEDSPAMIGAGQAVAATSTHHALRQARWAAKDAATPIGRADLVVASYVLGELQDPVAAVETWWNAAAEAILIIEPGTPAGFERILRARAQLVHAGASVAAPCPHDGECPLVGGRWCHFAVRVARSPLHRAIKAGTLSSEDEKFSYVAAVRSPVGSRSSRVLREPSRHGGHVRLELCSQEGLRDETVSRRDPRYPYVRKLRWGDSLAPRTSDPLGSFALAHLASANFRRLTLSGATAGADERVRKAVIRPVEIQGTRMLQVVTYDQRRATTVNVRDASSPVIVELLRRPFRHVAVSLADEVLEGRVTKKGNLLTSRTAVDERAPDLRHDRRKHHPVPEDAPFLDVLGVSSDGLVKPSRRGKYRQINEFIRLLDLLPLVEGQHPLRLLDVGCGSAYLTFAAVHHLVQNRGIDCLVVGVDRDDELIQRNRHRARDLGWSQLHFEVGSIETYEPDERPDVVLALHACDTAADHALAAMVRWGSGAGFVAPCCHHHIQRQLRRQVADPGDQLLVRDGILRERLGDVLTDATRAALLRRAGYDVDVVQFVDPEHTPRNTLLRARKRSSPEPAGLREAYEALVARWSVQPLLADLLGSRLGIVRTDRERGG